MKASSLHVSTSPRVRALFLSASCSCIAIVVHLVVPTPVSPSEKTNPALRFEDLRSAIVGHKVCADDESSDLSVPGHPNIASLLGDEVPWQVQGFAHSEEKRPLSTTSYRVAPKRDPAS